MATDWLRTNLLSLKVLRISQRGLEFISPVYSFTWDPHKGEETIEGSCKIDHTKKDWYACICGIYSSQEKNFLREYMYGAEGFACFLLATIGKTQVWTAGDEYPCAYTLRSEKVRLLGGVYTGEDDQATNAAIALFNFPMFPMSLVIPMIQESWKQHKDISFDPYDLETWRKYNG